MGISDNHKLDLALSRPECLISDIGCTNARFALLFSDGEVHQQKALYQLH